MDFMYGQAPTTERGKKAMVVTTSVLDTKKPATNICKDCGCHIRSDKHQEGAHHRKMKPHYQGRKAMYFGRLAERHGVPRNVGDLRVLKTIPAGFGFELYKR